MIAYVHKSTGTNGGPVAVAIAVVFVVLCIGLWVWTSVKRRSVRRQLVSDADQYAPMLANEPVPSAHEWRPLSGAEASPGVLIPPWLGGVPDRLPAALEFLHLLAPHVDSPRATTVEDAEFRVFGQTRVVNNGNKPRQFSTTCVDFTIPAACPMLMLCARLAPNGAMTSGVGSSVLRTESNDFNNTYLVMCKDHRFGFSFIDAGMMEWLLAAPGLAALAVMGGDVFIELQRHRDAPIDYEGALKFAVGLRKRIPEVVSHEWAPR